MTSPFPCSISDNMPIISTEGERRRRQMGKFVLHIPFIPKALFTDTMEETAQAYHGKSLETIRFQGGVTPLEAVILIANCKPSQVEDATARWILQALISMHKARADMRSLAIQKIGTAIANHNEKMNSLPHSEERTREYGATIGLNEAHTLIHAAFKETSK